MKISDIGIRYISLGKDRGPIDYAGSSFGTYAIVQVFTDEGVTGISRVRTGTGRDNVGETIEGTLKPLILGEDPRNPERLWWKMYRASYGRGVWDVRTLVRAVGTLDIALWDIAGKAAELPLYKMWGGYRDRIPVNAGQFNYPVGSDYSKELAIIERYMDEGYSAIKVHLGPDEPAMGVEKVLTTRKRVGDDKMFAIDLVSARWGPWEVAEAIKGFEEANLAWLEDFFCWDDKLGSLAFVSSLTHIPIASGEQECGLPGWRDLIVVGGVKILVPDCITGGGFSQVNRAAHLAQAFNCKFTTHSSSHPEFGAQFVAAHSNGLIQTILPESAPTQEWSKLYKEPLVVKDGWLEMPQRPGLGMEFDEDFIAHYQL